MKPTNAPDSNRATIGGRGSDLPRTMPFRAGGANCVTLYCQQFNSCLNTRRQILLFFYLCLYLCISVSLSVPHFVPISLAHR